MSRPSLEVVSQDGGASLAIKLQPEVSRWSAIVRVTWGSYSVENDSVAFTNATRFLAELREVERSRCGGARLEGTYDVVIDVSSFESKGDAILSFVVSDPIFLPDSTYGKCELRAAFVVAGEFLGTLLSDFEELFA